MKKMALLLVVAVVVLLVYNLLMFYDNYSPYGRMRETPAVKPYEQPQPIMPAGLVPVDGGEALYRAGAPESLTSPFSPADTGVILEGATLYFTYCQQCHGINHDGKGTVGQSFAPLPRDLRSAAVQARSEGDIFKEISYGIPGGRQPPLATTIAAADRWKIVAFVKSLGRQ
ncbi:MAG: c-type cytochrome [Desulfobacterales bacterium]